MIATSGAPEHVRQLTLDALAVRGRWPKAQGPVTPIISVSITSLQDKAVVWRSTIQRRIQRAKKDKYWREVRAMNSWLDCPKCETPRDSAKCPKCPHKGNGFDAKEFRRTFTYAIDVEQFKRTPPCRQVQEIRDRKAGKRAPQPVAEMPAPQTQPSAPVRKTSEHQRVARPALTPRQTQELTRRIKLYEQGRTEVRDVNGWLLRDLKPGEPSYIKPLMREAAILAACKSMAQGDSVHELEPLNCTFQQALEVAKQMEQGP